MSIIDYFGNDQSWNTGYDVNTIIVFGRFKMAEYSFGVLTRAIDGAATAITAYLSTALSGGGTAEFALYDDSLNFLAKTNKVPFPENSLGAWCWADGLGINLTANTYYYLALWGNNAGTYGNPMAVNYYPDPGPPGDGHVYADTGNVYDNWPASLVKDVEVSNTDTLCAYCEFVPVYQNMTV